MLNGQLVELSRRGHTITVATRSTNTDQLTSHSDDKFKVVFYNAPDGMGLKSLTQTLIRVRNLVDSLIESSSPDLIYIQQPLSGAGALLSRAARRLPAAYMFCSPWSDEYRVRLPQAANFPLAPDAIPLNRGETLKLMLRKHIEGTVMNHTQRKFIMSDFMLQRCIALHQFNNGQFTMVPGGVDTNRFYPPPDRAALRSSIGFDADQQILLTVRNLHPRMGIGNLISAMPGILALHPDTLLIIGGTGVLGPSLRDQVRTLGIEPSVRFAGFIPEEELPKYYGAADLFVLPTAALEGFGMVTVEAMACGTPVIGTPVGATPELLRRLDPSLVLAGLDSQSIQQGCIDFLNRGKGQRNELRSKCRSHALELYSWESVTNIIENTLQSLLRVPGSSPSAA